MLQKRILGAPKKLFSDLVFCSTRQSQGIPQHIAGTTLMPVQEMEQQKEIRSSETKQL